MLLCLAPSPISLSVIGAVKFVPVNVTFTTVPSEPEDGLIEVIVGTALPAITVKDTLPLVPADVVTDTDLTPVGALPAIFSVAVICVELTTTRFDTVTPPAPLTFNVAPLTKLAPDSITGTEAPCIPLPGESEDSVGGGDVTVNVTTLLVPTEVITYTLSGPMVAVALRVKVAVICVEFTTTILLCLAPSPISLSVIGAVKFVPVSVTFTEVPGDPLLGETLLTVGGAIKLTVAVCETPLGTTAEA
jgi:hypothetical protein